MVPKRKKQSGPTRNLRSDKESTRPQLLYKNSQWYGMLQRTRTGGKNGAPGIFQHLRRWANLSTTFFLWAVPLLSASSVESAFRVRKPVRASAHGPQICWKAMYKEVITGAGKCQNISLRQTKSAEAATALYSAIYKARPFGVAKRSISRAEKDRIRVRNGPFRNAKR